ncbi:hypothetical protein [Mycobacterium sp.]|uniref:hypothetical protein n=1 Tax=Mycobacterium sp. TaxID=1785 RepID=UPI003F9C13BE
MPTDGWTFRDFSGTEGRRSPIEEPRHDITARLDAAKALLGGEASSSLRSPIWTHELLHELNVKRSAFVCALLAQFPDVVVRSTRPIILELISR